AYVYERRSIDSGADQAVLLVGISIVMCRDICYPGTVFDLEITYTDPDHIEFQKGNEVKCMPIYGGITQIPPTQYETFLRITMGILPVMSAICFFQQFQASSPLQRFRSRAIR